LYVTLDEAGCLGGDLELLPVDGDRNHPSGVQLGSIGDEVSKVGIQGVRDAEQVVQGDLLPAPLDVRDRRAGEVDLLRELVLGLLEALSALANSAADQLVEPVLGGSAVHDLGSVRSPAADVKGANG